jgi:hypothetical protein
MITPRQLHRASGSIDSRYFVGSIAESNVSPEIHADIPMNFPLDSNIF